MNKKTKQEMKGKHPHGKSLLLWPGVLIVLIQWLVRFALPKIVPSAATFGMLFGLFTGLMVMVWWAIFSRAASRERWMAILLMFVAMAVTSTFLDESIKTGMQGMMFIIYCIPVLSLGFVVWAVATSRLRDQTRRILMVMTILLSCGLWTLLRCDGISGNAVAFFSWRWSDTSEERFLSDASSRSLVSQAAEETSVSHPEWPGFRGVNRDGIIHGVKIETDWTTSPPVELWRRQIGPGCSSFAVHGDLFYTQEQRGDFEIVSCYQMSTGDPVWIHSDSARFYDSHAGAGPRSTPTLHKGIVFTMGATGILNALNANNGNVIWSRKAIADTNEEIPEWGITSSPLVVDENVIIAFTGSLVAYDINTGVPRWYGPDGGSGYSSPHILKIDGVEQVLLMSKVGAISVLPADGKILWKHEWEEADRIVQPAISPDGEILILAGYKGTRRISVTNGTGGWATEERWTTVQLKPFFNDFIIHKSHVYGFIGPSLACLDAENGTRNWRGGRYGGQIVLIADQDLLLVLTEKGEIALVKALPDQFLEIARIPAIAGKTWNHPVLAGNILLVRNAEQMVAFRLMPG